MSGETSCVLSSPVTVYYWSDHWFAQEKIVDVTHHLVQSSPSGVITALLEVSDACLMRTVPVHMLKATDARNQYDVHVRLCYGTDQSRSVRHMM